jgi:hypothetical protein
VLAALLLAQPGPGLAQSPPASGGAAPAGAPVVAAEAIDALARMGTFLRSHRAFTVRADTTTDQVLDTGQKIQFDSAVDLRARLPDRLRADVRSARMERQFFYDGRTLTLYGARVKYYATVAAPPTIRELVQVAETKYGLQVPLADLFLWGTDEARAGDIQGALVVGPSRIGGVECSTTSGGSSRRLTGVRPPGRWGRCSAGRAVLFASDDLACGARAWGSGRTDDREEAWADAAGPRSARQADRDPRAETCPRWRPGASSWSSGGSTCPPRWTTRSDRPSATPDRTNGRRAGTAVA